MRLNLNASGRKATPIDSASRVSLTPAEPCDPSEFDASEDVTAAKHGLDRLVAARRDRGFRQSSFIVRHESFAPEV